MDLKDLEELVYDYGHLQYRIGRMETDDKTGTKEYAKIFDQKDKILNQIGEFFKTKQQKR